MKTMGHKLQTRLISALLVFVMVFAAIVSAGLVLDVEFGDIFNALGFGKGSSGSDLALNTTKPDYDFITAGGGWGYEIDMTTEKMKLDGIRDNAYNSGVTIPAKFRVNSDGTFNVSFASDGVNIYVLYEVEKANGIVYDANKAEKYHLDCADFVLSLNAEERRAGTTETIGKEFRILGGVEGGVGTAITDTATDAMRNLGVQDWYVKHTDKGFNIEFTIPLSKVTGKVNGNKAISFTAVATIAKSTSSRVYPVADKATGGEDKHMPSVIVVKDGDFTTANGNFGYEVVKSATALALDGQKDTAYTTNGFTLPARYNLSTTSASTYDVSFAADGEYAYFLYEFHKAEQIFMSPSAGGVDYKYDCADFVIDVTAHEALGTEFRIGFDKDGKPAAGGFPYGAENFTVVAGEGNDYNVEFRIPLTSITGNYQGKQAYTFTAVATIATAKTGTDPTRTYPVALKAAAAEAKAKPSMVVITDGTPAATPATGEIDYAKVDYTINAGQRWGYFITEAEGRFVIDGLKDEYYKSAVKIANGSLANGAAINPNNTYDVYVAADDEKVAILWEFTDDNIITNGHNVKNGENVEFYNYYNDAAQFCLTLDGRANGGGGVVVDYGKGPRAGIVTQDGYQIPYFVTKTEKGFNVEISFPRSVLLNQNTFGFMALSSIASSDTSRTYGFMKNPNGAGNLAKENVSQFQIIDNVYGESAYDVMADGRYKYTLEATDETLLNDGYKDPAYASGLTLQNKYNRDGKYHAENNYTLYLAADAKNVNMFFEVIDDYVVTQLGESGYWRNDCVHFAFNKTGGATKKTDTHFRPDQGVGTRTYTHDGVTFTYTIVYTDKGYNIEVSVPRAQITEGNLFSFMPRLSIATSTTVNTYGFIENASKSAADGALNVLNQVEIVDLLGEVQPSPTGYETLEDGRYSYTLNAGTKALTVDGVKDDAYAIGLSWDAIYNLPTGYEGGFTAYMAADASYVYIFVDVADDNVVGAADASAWYRADCVDFIISGAANATEGTSKDVRIFGNLEGGLGTADARNLAYAPSIADLYVKATEGGYAVEVKLDRSKFTDSDVFSFLAMSGACKEPITNATVYPCIANGAGEGGNKAKDKLNEVKIVDQSVKYENVSDLYTEFSAPVAGTTPVINPANTPANNSNGYNQYKVYSSNISLDGYKDDTYANAAHFYGDLHDNAYTAEKFGTSFDAYVAYGSDGYIYFYADIYDDYVNVPEELWPGTYWHTDLMQIYTWNTTSYNNDQSNVANTVVYSISAPVDDMTNSPNAGIQPVMVERRLTENGWSFEAKILYSGATLKGGESLAVKFFYNDNNMYVDSPQGNIHTNAANESKNYGYGKSTVTHSDYKYPAKYDSPNDKADWEATNRVRFEITAAPVVDNDASIFQKMYEDPTKVAIVYPKDCSEALLNLIKYPSLAVQTQASNASGLNPDFYASLAPLSNTTLTGAAVLEEGDPAIANYTYKVLVGHVNSYDETRAMIETIGYDKYGVGVFGNTVSIIGATEQMLKKAVDTFKAEVAGTLTPATLYYGTSPAVAGAGLDWIADTRLVSDNGYGSYQIIRYKNVAYRDFETVSNVLLAKGYQLVSSNIMDGKYYSRTFYNATDIITVSYGLHYNTFMYVNQSGNGGNNLTDANLDDTANSLRISVASRAIADIPTVSIDEYEKVTDTVYVHATQDWDLVEIVRLENGEFIIFDAAHTADAQTILQELYALSNGEKPVVAAWFLTHFHQDHIGGLTEIGTKYADKIVVKNVIQHMGSEHILGTCYNYRGTQPSTSDKTNILNFLPAIENLDANLVISATGQVFNFANASVEILYTFADSMPFSIAADNTNRTDSVYALNLRVGTTNQRFIITGDATTEEFNLATKRYGSYLKSDFLQLAHHGNGEANDRCTTFYKTVDPSYIIIPRAYIADTGYGASDQAAIDYVKAKYSGQSVNEDDYIIAARKYVTNADISSITQSSMGSIANGAQNVYVPTIRRLAIPYSLGKTMEFPGVGATFTYEFNNTATGTKDSENGAVANTDNRITQPTGMLENGSYVYVANTFYGNITTDGTKDVAYSYGIHLKSDKADNSVKDVTYEVWLVAGQDGKIHVYYEVTDNYYFVTSETGWNNYRMDGVDFSYGFKTLGTLDGNFRIKAYNGTQTDVYTDGKLSSLLKNDYAVKVTAADGTSEPVIGEAIKYTVEFTIDNNGKNFTNGDMMTFLPVVNSITSWEAKEDGKHTNVNVQVDNAFTSAYGGYWNPMNTPSQGVHNVLVFSSAPATQQAQRPANGSDNDVCVPNGQIVNNVEYVGSIDKNVSVNIAKNAADGKTISATTSVVSAQAVYGIGTAYADITLDGEMENIYKYGLKVSDKYVGAATDPGTHGFDAYIVYGQDGKVHVFVEVTDSTMTKDSQGNKIGYGFEKDNEANYWRKDSVHFYYNFNSDGTTTNNSAKTIWIGAVAGGNQAIDESGFLNRTGLPAEGTYFVKMTDNGYNVEFILDRNGSDFRVGDYFEFGLYLNCAYSEVGKGNTAGNTDKYSLTHGSYYIDNYAKKYVDPSEYAFDGVKIMSANSIASTVEHEHNYTSETTDATCTVAGKTVYTCTDCGHSYEVAIPATGHNTDGTIEHKDATCTETGVVGGKYCTVCEYGKAAAEEEIPATGHAYGDDHICDACEAVCEHEYDGKYCVYCDREKPRFTSRYLTLKDDIAIKYELKDSLLNNGYVFSKVVFTSANEQVPDLTYDTLPALNGEGIYTFAFGMPPYAMGDDVTVTLYVTYNGGEEIAIDTLTYTVKQYCDNQLASNTISSELKTLLIELLNYGAAAQKYVDQDVEDDALLNAGISADDQAEIEAKRNTTFDDVQTAVDKEDVSARLASISVTLREGIWYNFEFVVLDSEINVEDISIKITVEGGATYTISEFNETSTPDRYQFTFKGVRPHQLRNVISVDIYNGDELISGDTFSTSIESYASRQSNSVANEESLRELIKMMMYYGDAAAAYESNN